MIQPRPDPGELVALAVRLGLAKLLSLARHAARQGLAALHLIDGRMPHALVAELFTEQGVGTLITRQVR